MNAATAVDSSTRRPPSARRQRFSQLAVTRQRRREGQQHSDQNHQRQGEGEHCGVYAYLSGPGTVPRSESDQHPYAAEREEKAKRSTRHGQNQILGQ